MATYYVKVVRGAGTSPLGTTLPYAEETLTITADTKDQAYKISLIKSSIRFMGQQRRTFIRQDGEPSFTEYFDPRY